MLKKNRYPFKRFVAITGASLLLHPLFAQAPADTINISRPKKTQLTFLPESHLIPLFTADERAHRTSICNIPGGGELIGSMGGIFPVARIGRSPKRAFQFSVASTLYTTLIRARVGGSLLNTDFFVDIMLDLKLNDKYLVRVGSGHTSQHLSDDVVNKYLGINYVRDYHQLFLVRQFPKQRLMTYAGFIYNFNLKTTNDSQALDLSNRPMFQLGFEHAPWQFSRMGQLYWAGDIKFRGEVNYGTTQNIQAGVKFMNASKRTFRIAANYSWGYDERGQFYTHKRSFFSAGFYFDF